MVRSFLLAGVGTLATLSVAAGCGSHGGPAPPAAAHAARTDVVTLSAAQAANAGIRSVRVAPETVAPQLTTVATIESDPAHLARVGPRAAGRIVAVHVALGDHVQRGQPLLGVDTNEYHDTAREYFQALAADRLADQELVRTRDLATHGLRAAADVERAQANGAAAAADLHEAEEHLHALGLDDAEIRRLASRSSHGQSHGDVLSPIDGQVVELTVTLGQVVAGTESVVTVADLREVWAVLRVYERDLGGVRLGTPVEVAVPSYPDRIFRGEVGFLGALVDPATRTVEARVRLDNADGALRPGMTATATVRLPTGPPMVMLPADAVQTIDDGPIVFVRVGANRFAARPVRVGTEQAGRVPILSGVGTGDDVVVAGAMALRGEHERAALEDE